jgi:hypothetical protein
MQTRVNTRRYLIEEVGVDKFNDEYIIIWLNKAEMEFRLCARINVFQNTIINEFFTILNKIESDPNVDLMKGYIDIFKFEYGQARAHLIHLFKGEKSNGLIFGR